MRSTRPPKVAKWLLGHFGSSPNNDSVIGDLDERYRAGRSEAWYWRQALWTILVSFVRAVCGHKLMALRAVVIGWSLFIVSRYGFEATRRLIFALAVWYRVWPHDWIQIGVQPPEIFVAGALTAWIVARLHRQQSEAMVLAYMLSFTIVQTLWLLPYLAPFRFFPMTAGWVFSAITTIGLVGGGVYANYEITIATDDISEPHEPNVTHLCSLTGSPATSDGARTTRL